MAGSEEGWHAVALSGSIEAGSSSGTRLFGEEIVIWRDVTGVPQIWEDRCPHRGMRLSFGFVRGDRIACLYHGWEFGAEGRCLRIPAHPRIEVPPTITVWRHGCREAMGMIFARLRDTAGEPALPPEVTGLALLPVRSLYVDCPAETLAQALAATMPEPFDRTLAETDLVARREGMMAILGRRSGERAEYLFGAVQAIADGRAAAHLVLGVSGGEYRGAGQRHYAGFAGDLRERIEAQTKAMAA